MPESLRAFCRIVSFTAAKTRRIFVVSVAWVRLELYQLTRRDGGWSLYLLGIEIEVGSIDLVESP